MKKNLPAVGVKAFCWSDKFKMRGNTYDSGEGAKRVKTQKVWSNQQAFFYKLCFRVARGIFMMCGPFCVWSLSPYGSLQQHVGPLFLILIWWMVFFVFFGAAYLWRWSAHDPLCADQIIELYKNVSVCPSQKEIIQEAVRNNFTLRNRDLQFALKIKKEYDDALAKREEEIKRQVVLSAIKQDL